MQTWTTCDTPSTAVAFHVHEFKSNLLSRKTEFCAHGQMNEHRIDIDVGCGGGSHSAIMIILKEICQVNHTKAIM